MVSHAELGVMERIRHFWCGLHGHDMLLQFAPDRMFLECVSCGRKTPGWELDGTRPVSTLRTERVRPIVRPRLVSARRVA